MTFTKQNQKERMRFVDQWAEYVRTHDDKDWSRQQNVIIDSCLQTASMSKDEYLAMKGEHTRRKKQSVVQ